MTNSLWKLLKRIRPGKKSTRHTATEIHRYQFEQLEPRTLLTGTIPTVPVPVAHWTFDEGAGATAADATGNGHAATLSAGATWATGNVGTHALNVNGSSTGMATATGAVVDTSASFTVSAWVNLASLSGYQTFASIAGTSVAGFFLQLRGDTGTFAFTRLSSDATGNSTYASATSKPLAGTWYHLIGVDDTVAGTLSLYVDGQLTGTAAYTSAWTASGNTLIGHGFYNGSQVDYVNGYIDDVEFFSSALSAAQVTALDQPAAYPFDEGAGTTAADYSGHGNTLTLGAAASWGAGDIGSNSLAVNGTTTSIATDAAPVLNTALPFSVSAWVNLNSTSGTQPFASIDGTNVSGFALQLRADTGKFAFTRLASDSSSAQVFHADATTAPSAGVWYNLLGVNDVADGMLLLYVNGILQSSVSYSGGWQATGATVVGAGKSGGARTNLANALIDEVRFFDSPLTAGAAAIVGTNGGGILTINSTVTGVTVSSNLFGAFMEDINYGGEGGIYNNEVRNSGFNDSSNTLNAWAAVAGAGVTDTLTSDTTTGPTSALTMSGKLAITSGVSASARAGISNSGYFGVAVAPSTTYTATFYAKATAGFTGPLSVTLESTAGTIYASATVAALTTSWAKYTVTLTTGAGAPTSATNLFVISTNSASANGATIWFGATYLYPPSYDNSPAHLRVDLMQKLVDLHPAIFRVPGGNYLEGNDYADRFNWQATIGPVENRPGHMNPWGYWSTDDMGLDEYLQMAELAGAQPVLAVYAGYTLNGTSDTGTTLTNDVTDAVNELHYVLDPVTTYWGALRAANGHADPYNVNYVEIGNEDGFSSTYSTRYPLFYNAIKAAFPNLKIIATSSSTGGTAFDVLDDHYYPTPQWFLSNSTHYDSTTRGSYKIFVGEYAARDGYQTSSMLDALGDAAWLMGLERDSDLVVMSSYAPIWVNVNTGGQQWATDLIGFNNTSSFGSASYYAQQMLNLNHGSLVIGDTIIGSSNLQAIVTRTGGAYYVTVVNPGASASTTTINIAGVSNISSTGEVITLAASSATAVNSISNPTLISPVTTIVSGLASTFTQVFPAYSLTILKFSTGDSAPTVATPAAASPATVTAAAASLSVLGADPAGESNLNYTWSATGTPPAAVTFSANGANDAKNTIATFSKAGAYNLSVAITNALGLTVYSVVTVTVNQTLTGATATVSPVATTVAPGGSTQFGMYGTDQFGDVMAVPPGNTTWSVYSGSGAITSAGLYTAPAGSSGIATIRAITSTGQILYANATILSEAVWYPANATSGTTLADASGSGKDATLSGAAAFGAGVSGNALSLSGGYASLPTGVVSTLNDFTIAAWVKIDTLSTWSRIFDFGTGTTVNMFLTPRSGSGTVRFAITASGGSNEQQINGTSALATGSWQYVAVTLSGNTGTLYVNGVAVGTNSSMTLRPSSLGSTTQNYLGDSQYTADPALIGSIDDFRIIGRALSAAEIQQFMYPTVVTAASASSATSTSALLSVLGADATGGESSLKYTWSATGTPPAPVTFSTNGANAAKNTTATFTKAGTYAFAVTIANAAGLTTTTTVNYTVDQTPKNIAISPTSGSQFAVTGTDQFGNALPSSAAFAWPTAGLTLQIAADGNLHIYQTGTTTNVVTPYAAAGLNSVAVTGLNAGGEALTVDLSTGKPIPAGGITFNGGTGGANSLFLIGAPGGNSVVMSAAQITDNSLAPIYYSNVTYFGFNLTGGSNSLSINSATLKINQDNAISAGTSVTIQSGTLDLNGKTDTIGSLLLKSGSVVNGTLYASSYVIESGTATANIVGPGGLQKTTSAQATTGAVSASSVTVTAGQLTATSINTGTLTLGAGTTLTIAAIPGGPAAGSASIPLAATTVQPITTDSASQESTVTESVAASSSTVESAVIAESQSAVQSAVAEVVVQSSPAVEDATQEALLATSTVSAMPLTESSAQSKPVDTAVNHLSIDSPTDSKTDSPTFSLIVASWSQGAFVGQQAGETRSTAFASSRDQPPFAPGMTGKRASASALNNWLTHSAALQTIVSHPNRNAADAEAVLDVARHARAGKHASQLENALDRVLAEDEDAFLLI